MSRARLFVLIVFLGAIPCACNRPPAGFYEIKSSENVAYVTRGKQPLYIDVYQPTNVQGPRPAVLLLHGGGWVMGNRTYERDLARFLASMGYVAATAQYRLCNKDVHHPIPVQDALAAVKFLRSHAADYAISPDRIVVGGESAGGHLSLLVGLAPDHSIFKDDSFPGVSSKVSAVIDIYGPTDLVPCYKEGSWVVNWFLDSYLGGSPRKFPDAYAEATPLTYVRSDAPPVLIVHGDQDDMVLYKTHAEKLYKALRDAGAHCQLVRVRGAGHGWGLNFTGNDSMRTLPAITHFLAKAFPD